MDMSKITNPQLRGMIELCRREVPGFTIEFKNRSRWMKFLNLFVQLFNKNFMSRYTTTLGKTVYVVSEKDLLAHQDTYAEILAHELCHMVERQQEGGVWNTLRYAFPQILAAFSLLALLSAWSLWFLLALLFLLALAPIPAPGRRDIELDGYTMSMSVHFWRAGDISDELFEHTAKQFTSSAYYYMWPWRDSVVHELKMRAQLIRTGEILRRPLFSKVRAVFVS